jgi:hypothetical protein
VTRCDARHPPKLPDLPNPPREIDGREELDENNPDLVRDRVVALDRRRLHSSYSRTFSRYATASIANASGELAAGGAVQDGRPIAPSRP